MQIILFEDDRAAQLSPIATAKPVFAISCGSYRLVFLLRELGPICTLVRKHLHAVEAETFPERTPPDKPLEGPALFVNARLVPSISILRRLQELVAAQREGVVLNGDSIAAAYLHGKNGGHAIWLASGGDQAAIIKSLKLPPLAIELPLFEYPHDVLRHHLACCRENLEHRIQADSYRQLRDGLFVADNVTLGDHLAIDTRHGLVVIDHDAAIGPLCFLRGPVYIGPNARLNEHTSIKDNVSLGHHAKVGGEVEGSVIESYSNKQHHGFLGHSYLGSWVNLGAGTSNSDLKNTYGTVNMDYAGQKVSTGMQFVGCFVGEYAKSAINTSIFTGRTIGVCSTLYGFVTTNVPSFCNYARTFGQVTNLSAEVMIAIQQRSFARRQVEQRECDIQLIRDMYDLAQQERQLPDEPLSL